MMKNAFSCFLMPLFAHNLLYIFGMFRGLFIKISFLVCLLFRINYWVVKVHLLVQDVYLFVTGCSIQLWEIYKFSWLGLVFFFSLLNYLLRLLKSFPVLWLWFSCSFLFLIFFQGVRCFSHRLCRLQSAFLGIEEESGVLDQRLGWDLLNISWDWRSLWDCFWYFW